MGAKMRKKTHAEFVEQIKKINPSITILSEYDGDTVKVLCKCHICNHEWLATPSRLIQKRGCPECGKKRSDDSKRKSPSVFINQLKSISPSIKIIGQYESSHKKIDVQCGICGYSWSPIPSSLLRGSGCPACAGTIKKTHSQFLTELQKTNQDVEVLDKYINDGTKIKIRCKKCNNIWFATPNSLLQGHGCRNCHFTNLAKKRTLSHNEFINRLKDVNPEVTILDAYSKSNEPIRAKCNKCGYEWTTKPSLLLSGRGCHLCGIEKQSASIRKSQTVFEKELNEVNPNIIVRGKYSNSITKIQVECKKCGNVWENSPGNLLSGRGCPRCARYLHTSFPEQTIFFYLKKIYDDAISGYKELFDNNMELDIYVPSIKTGIEYDGKAWHSSDASFAREQHKYDVCKLNQIKLIRIKEQRKENDIETADILIYREDSLETVLLRLFDILNVSIEVDIDKDAPLIAEQYQNIDANNVFVERLNEINPDIIPLSKYVTASAPMFCECKICNFQWKTNPNKLLSGTGCPKCAGKMRKNTEQFKTELSQKNPYISVVGEYVSASSPIAVSCNKCNYMWSPVASSLLAGNGCPRCGKRLRITHKQFVEEMRAINEDIQILGEYKTKKKPVTVKCRKCGRVWDATPDSLLRGHGCAKCSGILKKTTKEFKDEISKLNNHFEVIGEYINARTKILVRCTGCGFERFAVPDSLLRGLKCPLCDGQ